MPVLRVATRALTWICAAGAGISMAALFGIVFVNSLRRYTIGKSVEWGEELPIYLAIYGVMFGTALAYLQDRHIRFTVVTDFLPDRVRDPLWIVVDLVVIVVGGLLAWSGWLFAASRGAVEASGIVGLSRDLSAATGVPWLTDLGQMEAWQFSMSLGGVILALAALAKLAARIASANAEKG